MNNKRNNAKYAKPILSFPDDHTLHAVVAGATPATAGQTPGRSGLDPAADGSWVQESTDQNQH